MQSSADARADQHDKTLQCLGPWFSGPDHLAGLTISLYPAKGYAASVVAQGRRKELSQGISARAAARGLATADFDSHASGARPIGVFRARLALPGTIGALTGKVDGHVAEV
jgi:hypothetical protein